MAGEADLTGFLDPPAGMLGAGHRRRRSPMAWAGWFPKPTRPCSPASSPSTWPPRSARPLTAGIDGWRDDDLAFTRDWGLSLDALGHATPVAIWQGGQDRMVPSAHGEWLAENIPLARARHAARRGPPHLDGGSLGQILDDLMSLARPPGPGSG